MKTAMASTSLEAFHSLPVADYLQPKEQAVMALFTGPEVSLTRQQISARAQMPLHCVCGRVNSLVTKGALEECGTLRDAYTGKSRALLQLPQSAQASLLEAAHA